MLAGLGCLRLECEEAVPCAWPGDAVHISARVKMTEAARSVAAIRARVSLGGLKHRVKYPDYTPIF